MGCNVLIDNSEFIINHYDRDVMLIKMKTHSYLKNIFKNYTNTRTQPTIKYVAI